MERYSEPSQIIPFFRLLLKKAVCGPDYEYSIFFDKQLSKKNRPFPKHRPRCWSCDRRWYPDCCMIVHAARYFPSQLPRGVAGVVSSRGRPCGALRMNAQGGAAGGDARAALTDRALRSPQLARWLLARPAPSTDVPTAECSSRATTISSCPVFRAVDMRVLMPYCCAWFGLAGCLSKSRTVVLL